VPGIAARCLTQTGCLHAHSLEQPLQETDGPTSGQVLLLSAAK
jgi:hypothetical protein